MKTGLLATLILGLLAGGLGQTPGQEPPLSDKECQLADLINQTRAENGLGAIEVGVSLTKIARLHVGDLTQYKPDEGSDSRGEECNLHSWSNHGGWTPVCYTDDHQYASLMWSKPRELTSYTGNGYEIAHFSGLGATTASAIASWKGSSDHLDVILERGAFAGHPWKSMGVGIGGNYACIWFGEIADPAGPAAAGPAPAPPRQATSTDHPDVAAFGAGLVLAAKKAVFQAKDPVSFTLTMTLPGTAKLERCRYAIQIYADGQWQKYFQSEKSFFKDLTMSQGHSRTWEWSRINEDGTHYAKPGKYRIRFRAPKHTSDILLAEFELKD